MYSECQVLMSSGQDNCREEVGEVARVGGEEHGCRDAAQGWRSNAGLASTPPSLLVFLEAARRVWGRGGAAQHHAGEGLGPAQADVHEF
jgi:hypothetical protein